MEEESLSLGSRIEESIDEKGEFSSILTRISWVMQEHRGCGPKLTRLKMRNLPWVSQSIYILFFLFSVSLVFPRLFAWSQFYCGEPIEWDFFLHFNQKTKKTALRGPSKRWQRKSLSSNDWACPMILLIPLVLIPDGFVFYFIMRTYVSYYYLVTLWNYKANYCKKKRSTCTDIKTILK